MNSHRRITVFLVLLALAGAIYLFLHKSEEDKIRKRLTELSETLSRTEAQGLMGKAQVLGSFQEIFANPVVLDTGDRRANGVYTPKELAATFIGIIQSGRTVSVSFGRPEIDLMDSQRAIVTATANVELREPSATQEDSTDVTIEFAKDKNESWVIESIRR